MARQRSGKAWPQICVGVKDKEGTSQDLNVFDRPDDLNNRDGQLNLKMIVG